MSGGRTALPVLCGSWDGRSCDGGSWDGMADPGMVDPGMVGLGWQVLGGSWSWDGMAGPGLFSSVGVSKNVAISVSLASFLCMASLVPRRSFPVLINCVGGKESLVHTVCACANKY